MNVSPRVPEPQKKFVRSVFEAKEYGEVGVPLTELLVAGRLHLYPEVTGKDYFRVYLRDDTLVFQAGGFVGLIPINDRVAIDVRPRVPIANLNRLLGLAEYPLVVLDPHRRYYETQEEADVSVLNFLALALLQAVAIIEAQGLFREYRRITADTSFPRGRMLLSETVSRIRSRGVTHKVAATWFEQSIDNGPNRCLRYTARFLAQRYRSIERRAGWRRIVTALNKMDHLLEAAHIDLTRDFLNHPLVRRSDDFPTTHAPYRVALPIAHTIIEDRGITFDGRSDDVIMASLLIDLDVVFEGYLRAVLRKALASRSPALEVQDGNRRGALGARKTLFDLQATGKPIDATPDIAIYQRTAQGAYPVVVEVKYKPLDGLPDRIDLNQVIAYAASYRSPVAVLVHPRANVASPRCSFLGRIGFTSVFVYRFDLSNTNLVAEEAQFVAAIRWLADAADAASEAQPLLPEGLSDDRVPPTP